jgi:dihydroxy-acid dehydratase
MEGGPVALVREGDTIAIDIPAQTITLKVDDTELAARREKWRAPAPKITKGYMARYARAVSSANTGAVIK